MCVCVCVCVYMYMYMIYIYVYMYTYIHAYIHTYIRTYMCVCLDIEMGKAMAHSKGLAPPPQVRVVSLDQKILIYQYLRVEPVCLYVWLYIYVLVVSLFTSLHPRIEPIYLYVSLHLYTLARLRDVRLLARCDVLALNPYSPIEPIYIYVWLYIYTH